MIVKVTAMCRHITNHSIVMPLQTVMFIVEYGIYVSTIQCQNCLICIELEKPQEHSSSDKIQSETCNLSKLFTCVREPWCLGTLSHVATNNHLVLNFPATPDTSLLALCISGDFLSV
jgi:hypothetical protein